MVAPFLVSVNRHKVPVSDAGHPRSRRHRRSTHGTSRPARSALLDSSKPVRRAPARTRPGLPTPRTPSHLTRRRRAIPRGSRPKCWSGPRSRCADPPKTGRRYGNSSRGCAARSPGCDVKGGWTGGRGEGATMRYLSRFVIEFALALAALGGAENEESAEPKPNAPRW